MVLALVDYKLRSNYKRVGLIYGGETGIDGFVGKGL